MAFNLKKGGSFALCPSGNHIARCYLIVDLGTQPREWAGKKADPVQMFRLGFEFPKLMHTFDEAKGPEPFTLSRRFTNSMGDKSSLKPFLNTWRGRPMTVEDIKTFTIDKLLGAIALVTVVHEVKKSDGATVAKIVSAAKAVVGNDPIPCPPAILKPINYSIDAGQNDVFKTLPEWIREECSQCEEWTNAPEDPGQGGDSVQQTQGQPQISGGAAPDPF